MFQDYHNCKYKNIINTVELENNNCLPFLGVLETREGNKCSSIVYRKGTFTGLGLSYMSLVPSIHGI